MQIEFDPDKDRANYAKYCFSLVLAVELDWDAALVWVDERCQYNEKGISLRRANRREVKRYVESV